MVSMLDMDPGLGPTYRGGMAAAWENNQQLLSMPCGAEGRLASEWQWQLPEAGSQTYRERSAGMTLTD